MTSQPPLDQPSEPPCAACVSRQGVHSAAHAIAWGRRWPSLEQLLESRNPKHIARCWCWSGLRAEGIYSVPICAEAALCGRIAPCDSVGIDVQFDMRGALRMFLPTVVAVRSGHAPSAARNKRFAHTGAHRQLADSFDDGCLHATNPNCSVEGADCVFQPT